MADIKVLTVRLTTEAAHRVDVVARAEGVSVNEVFRLALEHYFQLKRADADFVSRARAMIARDAELVGGLN